MKQPAVWKCTHTEKLKEDCKRRIWEQ